MSKRSREELMSETIHFVYQLNAGHQKYFALVVPEQISLERVTAAWSYAVRYSAKGLDLPDYEGAVRLLLEHHPSWKVYPGAISTVNYDRSLAEKDTPET